MEDVLASYETGAAFDEMIDSDGNVRPSYAGVYETLRRAAPDELRSIAESLANNYSQAGVTFDVGGVERPFPLDVVPRVIPADDWDIIDSGVSQRIRALEAFLADVYSDGRVITDGVIPRQLVTSSSHYHRAVWGIEPPNGVRVHVGGIDLIRTPEGDVRVLEDNVRVPSGVSYVMTNRSAMVTAMPEAFGTQRIRPVNGYPQRLLAALRKAAPSGMDDPTVVVLTPGVYNSAYFEHTLLARTMGVELVEGRDLECRRGRVFMRTTAGLRRVDVIYRRIDDDFIDPVHFRQDSMLGVPGLVNAVRSGGVALANAIGNGVADDKLIYTYVPDLIRYYLREEPIIRNVDTWRLEEDAAREEVMDRLAELVVKPVDGSGGKGIVIGPVATTEELDALRARVLADPRGWIAQPLVQLSTVPTLIGSGLEPRHVDLRPFAVNSGDDIWVLPGGLTRVALPKGEIVVNSSQGGGSKDTWVLSQPLRLHAPESVPEDDEEDESETEVDTTPSPPAPPPPPAAPPGAAPAVPATAAAAATVTRSNGPKVTPSAVPLLVGGAPGTIGGKPESLQQQSEQQQQTGPDAGCAGRSAMLSRIAESMFWIGRYVERGDNTARMVQTQLRLIAEDTSRGESDSCRNLLALMSIDEEDYPEPNAADLLRLLCWDARESTSIFYAWAAARDNARRAREVIPLEVWECINTTWQKLPTGRFNTVRAYSFLDWARDRSALVSGLARSTMVRDDGWQFFLLGRCLEQVDMTSRMVASASPTTGSANWPSVLRGVGGHDAFLRTYKGLHTDAEAAEFLLVDARFPRSVMHGLVAAQECLEKVTLANPSGTEHSREATRLLGQLRARLEYTPMQEILGALDDEMTGVQGVCAVVSEVVATTFFAAADPTAWITEGTR